MSDHVHKTIFTAVCEVRIHKISGGFRKVGVRRGPPVKGAAAGEFERPLLARSIVGVLERLGVALSVGVAGARDWLETERIRDLTAERIGVVGVGWGAYAMSRPGHVGTEWEAMLPHLRSGALRPIVGAVHPLAEASAALQSLEGRTVTGKVVLTP